MTTCSMLLVVFVTIDLNLKYNDITGKKEGKTVKSSSGKCV
jgi:hypothetical protein